MSIVLPDLHMTHGRADVTRLAPVRPIGAREISTASSDCFNSCAVNAGSAAPDFYVVDARDIAETLGVVVLSKLHDEVAYQDKNSDLATASDAAH